jgi:hypothetical protein
MKPSIRWITLSGLRQIMGGAFGGVAGPGDFLTPIPKPSPHKTGVYPTRRE